MFHGGFRALGFRVGAVEFYRGLSGIWLFWGSRSRALGFGTVTFRVHGFGAWGLGLGLWFWM